MSLIFYLLTFVDLESKKKIVLKEFFLMILKHNYLKIEKKSKGAFILIL